MSDHDNDAASDLLVRCLEAEGVEYVFGLPGEENIWLIRSLKRSGKIRYVLVHHEQAASFMADIYGRLTGRAGVCSATLGPGGNAGRGEMGRHRICRIELHPNGRTCRPCRKA